MEVGKRVVFKVSGEALRGKLSIDMNKLYQMANDRIKISPFYGEYIDDIAEEEILRLIKLPSNIDEEMVEIICNGAKELHDNEREVIVVPGAGNLWRGRQKNSDMSPIIADQIGMLGINMNAMAIGEKLGRMGIPNRVVSSVPVEEFGLQCNDVIQNKRNLANGEVLIIGGGTGSPLCTSDSATVKAAHEYEADTILFGKSIDGIYDKDPKTNNDARKYQFLTYDQLIQDQIELGVNAQGVMDFEAMARLLKNPVDLIAYQANDNDAIKKILSGEEIGTTITKKVKKPKFY